MYLAVGEDYQVIGYPCFMKKMILVGFASPNSGIII